MLSASAEIDPSPRRIRIEAHPARFDPRRRLGKLPPYGELVRDVLEGSWRDVVPPVGLPADQLRDAAPLLIHSGAAALGWRRVSRSDAMDSEGVQELRATAQRLVFGDILRAESLRQIAAILNAAGVMPLVFKGWAATHYYAEPCLRPYGDFDLLVRPEDYATARATLLAHAVAPVTGKTIPVDCEPRDRSHWVDLHAALDPCYDLPVESVFSRAIPKRLGDGAAVLVPGHEDHLRIVALHFFKHGGCRPLWLCDIAAMVEAAGPDFDWERCLGEDPVTRSWMAAGIGAAHRMLGARVDHCPAHAWREPPSWLTGTLLREWRAPFSRRVEPVSATALLSDPRLWLSAHWPNPALAMFMRRRPAAGGSWRRWQVASFLTDHVRPAAVKAFDPASWRPRSSRQSKC